ncbi:lytic transglycosylase domain-containing protein [Paenibacillus puerhi]|uniref:lytic transglycosylase domain-containing protein n=1 Tax=Paenibacillus puerhi TaxID=2692622 RepID=UPI0013570C52|nr:lytic transglycosylase domain-containing protein [Paenibacillus puerhi]
MTIKIEGSDLHKLQRQSEASKTTQAAAPELGQEDGHFSNLLEGLMATRAAQQQAAGRSTATASVNFAAAQPSWGAYRSAFLGQSRPTPFEELIQGASQTYGVESSLVKAVIEAESSFNPNAVSRAGAKGLMQLMDDTGAGLGVTDPFDPAQNIAGGTKYLSNLLMKYNGNPSVALAAYNAGSGRVDRLGIRTDQDLEGKLHLLPAETQKYVRKVLELQNDFAS